MGSVQYPVTGFDLLFLSQSLPDVMGSVQYTVTMFDLLLLSQSLSDVMGSVQYPVTAGLICCFYLSL